MPPSKGKGAWTEDDLVRECLQGNQEAWSALVDRYKNLVYSVPAKYRITGDDANEIFQSVFFELLAHLSEIRQPKALPMWLIQTASHKCLRFKRGQTRFTPLEDETEQLVENPEIYEEVLGEWRKERVLSQALDSLSPRCRRIIEMLFFENPPRPYKDVAKALGVATGSIGFLRGRCMEKLRDFLRRAGFP